MIVLPHKTKQFLLVTVKILIVCAALFSIYRDLSQDKKMDYTVFLTQINVKTAFILLGLTIANWYFEILKWQNLVHSFQKISFFEASKQSMGSLTASIFTPNRIGEYGAKILFYPKEKRKQIIFLNFMSNSSQMFVTCVFGVIGFLTSKYLYSGKVYLWLLAFLLVILLLIVLRKIEIYGYSIQKLFQKVIGFPREILFKTIAFSTFRYLLFSHQFYLLLLVFGSTISYGEAMVIIFLMYFVASVLPNIHLFDVVVKGSVALFLFSSLSTDFVVSDWMVISATTAMWLLNLVLPVGVGSYFVLRFKPRAT